MPTTDYPTEYARIVIEDVIWLTDCHEHPENVARRLGYSHPDNLAQMLRRWGRESLARRLVPERVRA